MTVFVFVLSVTVALGVSFLCSLVEATLLSLTPSQVAQLGARHPTAGAIWRDFKSNIEKPIAAILVLNTAAHTIGASVAGAQFDEIFGDPWIWLFGLIFTFLMLQYTEILPKTLGIRLNQRLAPWLAEPLLVAVKALTPVIHVVRWINRPFEIRQTASPRTATLDEIISLAAMARHAKEIDPQHERIILGAAGLSRRRVSQIMIPVEQGVFLSMPQPLRDAFVVAQSEGHTRFPVCSEGDRDRLLGYVNFKELVSFMHARPDAGDLGSIIRPVISVDPDASASDLLRLFVEQHEHLAIVRSREGRTLGLVTLEDVVEQLVGEMKGEFDRLPRHVHEMTGGTWLFGGGVPMTEVAAVASGRLAEASGDLAAWMERELGRAPATGDAIERAGLRFEVCRTRRRQAFEVRVSWLP